MEKLANTFWKDNKGNGTIDWIVLTAGATFLSFGIVASLMSNSQNIASDEVPVSEPMATVQTL